MVWLLGFLCILLFVGVCVLGFFLYRFTSYIMFIEDDISEAIDVHERTVNTFNELLEMNMFFDSPDIQRKVKEVMDDVKVCKFATQKVAQTFVRLSKNKYVKLVDERSQQ